MALEAAATSLAIRDVCAGVFADWQALPEQRLDRDGLDSDRARAQAVFILSCIEGAMILCRTRRSTEPLRSVEGQIMAALEER